MADGDIVTFNAEDSWKNKVSGTDESLTGSFANREEAAVAGSAEAHERGVDHLVESAVGLQAVPDVEPDPPGDYPD